MAIFYAIGVGPGDPELLTLKAVKILKEIDYLIVPVTFIGKKSIALETVTGYLTEKTVIQQVVFPMVKETAAYEEAGRVAARLVESAINEGKNCAFITIGDPLLYSTFGYINKSLNEDIETVIIPGIPSFCAAAAAAGIVLAEKDEIMSVVPLTAKIERIEKAAGVTDCIIYMKVHKNLQKIKNLISGQQYTMLTNCGMREEKVTKDVVLEGNEQLPYLSLLIAKNKRTI